MDLAWACGAQMFGCRAEEMPQFEAAAVLTTQTRERGVERHQGSGCSRGRCDLRRLSEQFTGHVVSTVPVRLLRNTCRGSH